MRITKGDTRNSEYSSAKINPQVEARRQKQARLSGVADTPIRVVGFKCFGVQGLGFWGFWFFGFRVLVF